MTLLGRRDDVPELMAAADLMILPSLYEGLPTVGEVTDAMAVAKKTDGMLLVVRQNYCDRIVLADAVRQFDFIDSKILGVVINCTVETGRGYGKNYYRRYYKYYGSSYANNDRSFADAPKPSGKAKK